MATSLAAQLRSFTLAASKPASSRKVSGAEKEPDLDRACAVQNGWIFWHPKTAGFSW